MATPLVHCAVSMHSLEIVSLECSKSQSVVAKSERVVLSDQMTCTRAAGIIFKFPLHVWVQVYALPFYQW